MLLKRLALVLGCVGIVACSKKSPSSDTAPVTVNGSENIGWTQTADNVGALAALQYAAYVDGGRSELPGASCDQTRTSGGFDCRAPLPHMSSGNHTLELVSYLIIGGQPIESSRSAPLQLNVVFAAGASSAGTATKANARAESAWTGGDVLTPSGLRLRIEKVAGVKEPTDLAFAPDGRLFVAERNGVVRVVQNGQLLASPALALGNGDPNQDHLLALAIDPQFERTHHVYAIYSTPVDSNKRLFTLARFREAGNTLADPVVLRDDILASPAGEAASLRFGVDAKLFAAFDDGGNARLAGDLALPNGKVLRLNPDGTTPDDQASGIPLFAYPFRSPRGLDWAGSSETLWVADRDSLASGRLIAVTIGSDKARKRGVVRAAFPLPSGVLPSSMAFYRGPSNSALRDNLLVASEEGRQLLRLQLDPANAMRIVAMEPILQDRIGGIRAVVSGGDGTIYLATTDALARLTQ